MLSGRARGFVLALNSGSNCSTGPLVGSSPLPGSTPRETLKEGCSWGLVPVGQPWAWQWESWRRLSRQQGQGQGHSQEQVGSIPAAPRPPIQEGLRHGPSIAQAFLNDGGASDGVGREGAKREGQIEGRVEERERWGTQADRQGARETKRRREDVGKRQMRQKRNTPCPPGSRSSEKGRWTQGFWGKADLNVLSHWPRGCARTSTGEIVLLSQGHGPSPRSSWVVGI